MKGLPPIPRRPGSSVRTTLWVVLLCWLVYAALLSDFGLIFACWGDIPDADRVRIKLTPVMVLFGGKLLYDFVLLLRRRIKWWEYLVSLLIFYIAFSQLLLVNVSPLD